MKRCTRCGLEKEESEFHQNGRYMRASCKACTRAYRLNPQPTRTCYRPYFDVALGCEVKQCSRCHAVVPLAEYGRVNGHHKSACRECLSTDLRAMYWADPEAQRARVRDYQRSHPNEERERYQRWSEQNREYLLERYRQYNEAHREERRAFDRQRHAKETAADRHAQYLLRREYIRAYGQRYRQKYPDRIYNHRQVRRARMLGAARYEVVRRHEIITRDNSICYLCGHVCTPGVDLTLDHVIPLSRGGTHTKDNIRVCCWQCNNTKRAKLLEEM